MSHVCAYICGVCMCLSVVCVHVCMYVCTCMSAPVCMYVCIYMYVMCISTRKCLYIITRTLHVGVCVCDHRYYTSRRYSIYGVTVCVCVCVCARRACMCACMCVCVLLYVMVL